MTNSSEHEFDIIIATDCRFPGGTSSSVAEEIKAQHAAGMKTALLHVEGPVIRRTKAFNRKLVECVLDEKTVLLPSDYSGSCKLLLLRHPAVFSDKSALNCSIKSERRLMIANQVPRDIDIDRQYYSVLDVDRVISQSFGGEFEWCPIGPLVRLSLIHI